MILKPSAYSPYVSDVICLIIKEIFDPAYVSVVTGGRAENNCLLNEHFDYIFFTGIGPRDIVSVPVLATSITS